MKKIVSLLLCIVMLTFCLAACGEGSGSVPPFASQTEVSQANEESLAPDATDAAPEHDHAHINYKGLSDAGFTVEDMIAAEGREADFSFESNGSTAYAYNEVSLDELQFSQVQFFFSETGNRVSCTYSTDANLEPVLAQWQEAMTAIYGEPSQSGDIFIWRDGETANQIMLTKLNDTTIQLAFYFNAQ